MKIKGKKVEGPNRELIVIPRGDGPDIVLWAQAITDMSGFEQLCPAPEPPSKIVKGGRKEYNVESPEYLAQLQVYADKRMAYIVLKSLDIEENELEWETVELGNHKTWLSWKAELRDSGLSNIEVQRIQAGCYNANCLNEARVEEARANFQRGLVGWAERSSGLQTEPDSTKSGEPVSDGESNPQG